MLKAGRRYDPPKRRFNRPYLHGATPQKTAFFCVCLFECGVLFCVMCVICVLCLIVVPLPPGKNPFAV
jgi:hypothetical protein